MTIPADNLYHLLPSVYRIRDAQEGEPLKALLAIVEEQVALVERDIDHLYENWFIETCDEWLVPYIGDLLGVHPFHPATAREYSMRAYVANTLAYRRRKGTLSVLEQLARDVTGWPAKAVEFFQLLATSQQVNHVRPGKGGSLRVCGKGSRDALELLGGPFEIAAHTAEVRRMARGRGRYNLPNIGLFLWRQQAYAVSLATPGEFQGQEGCYRFDPFGRDIPLFMPPQREGDIFHLAEEINVPGKLRRFPLFLEAQRQRGEGIKPAKGYFGLPVFSIVARDNTVVEPKRIAICNLEEWQTPASEAAQGFFAVDPVLGRLKLPEGSGPADSYRLSYCYGFSADIGGGPYDRHASVGQWFHPDPKQPFWQLTVQGGGGENDDLPAVATLREAVDQWHTQEPGCFGVITISDSTSYREGDLNIRVPLGSTLAIVAARWLPGQEQRRDGIMVPDQLCPHLEVNIAVSGDGEAVIFDGLWIEGKLSIAKADLSRVTLSHCSVVSQQRPAPVTVANNDNLIFSIDHCIVGPLLVKGNIDALQISDSIVDGGSEEHAVALSGGGSDLRAVVERSTLIGSVHVTEVTASEVIFTGKVRAERCQSGFLRFCYLPLGENPDEPLQTPCRFRCQPSLEITDTIERRKTSGTSYDIYQLHKEVTSWLKPSFIATCYGEPAYGQLSPAAPLQIRAGAEDGSEMGVFCHLKQPQREANLRAALDEYLRAGLEAGIIYIDETRTQKEKTS